MIKGMFKTKKGANLFCFISGLILIILLLINGPEKNNILSRFYAQIFSVAFVFCVCNIILYFLNFRAFLTVDEYYIQGKFNWFNKIDCYLTDIEYASMKNNILSLFLKNGKKVDVLGLDNLYDICTFIRENLKNDDVDIDEINIQYEAYTKQRKKEIIYVIVCCALMFAFIFITVGLTDGREIFDFNTTDKIIFLCMCVAELFTIIITFYYALKTGKTLLQIEKCQYLIDKHKNEQVN